MARRKKPIATLILGALLAVPTWFCQAADPVVPPINPASERPVIPVTHTAPAAPPRIPIIHCTDLLHPHDDPDDHFDLACLYAMPEIDLRAVVFDRGDLQRTRCGRPAVQQLNHMTGARVTWASGLENKLDAPDDTGERQGDSGQGGAKLILQTLRESPRPVMISVVGSLRDVTAAFNRDPKLFREKVSRILVFAGEARDPKFREHNVELDPQAYIGMMRSGLPLWWVPCFDGGLWQNKGHASYWQTTQRNLLQQARPKAIQYFIYALEKETGDPVEVLQQPVDPEKRERLMPNVRNLWCAAVLGTFSDRVVAFDARRSRYDLIPMSDTCSPDAIWQPLFRFRSIRVTVNDQAEIHEGTGSDARQIMQFEVVDSSRYQEGMTAVTAQILGRLGEQ